jgi:hypothetical protein
VLFFEGNDSRSRLLILPLRHGGNEGRHYHCACSLFWLTAAQQDKTNQEAGTSAVVSSVPTVVENKIREAWQDF